MAVSAAGRPRVKQTVRFGGPQFQALKALLFAGVLLGIQPRPHSGAERGIYPAGTFLSGLTFGLSHALLPRTVLRDKSLPLSPPRSKASKQQIT